MLQSFTTVMAAAAIAAVITVLSAPTALADAGPLVKSVEIAMTVCARRPGPDLHCVDTGFGNWHSWLITTHRLAANEGTHRQRNAGVDALMNARYREICVARFAGLSE